MFSGVDEKTERAIMHLETRSAGSILYTFLPLVGFRSSIGSLPNWWATQGSQKKAKRAQSDYFSWKEYAFRAYFASKRTPFVVVLMGIWRQFSRCHGSDDAVFSLAFQDGLCEMHHQVIFWNPSL